MLHQVSRNMRRSREGRSIEHSSKTLSHCGSRVENCAEGPVPANRITPLFHVLGQGHKIEIITEAFSTIWRHSA